MLRCKINVTMLDGSYLYIGERLLSPEDIFHEAATLLDAAFTPELGATIAAVSIYRSTWEGYDDIHSAITFESALGLQRLARRRALLGALEGQEAGQ